MHAARALALVTGATAGLIGLTGCGANAGQEVQAKLQQYTHAVAARNTATLCGQVLAPQLISVLEARTGLSCRQAMTTYVDSVTDPTLSVSKVSVSGRRATAVVLTGARGQPAALATIHLRQGARGWRISSLSQPG